MEKDSATVLLELHREFKDRPELLPLFLRNIVVTMMRDVPRQEELWEPYLRVILELERAFPGELVWD